MLKQQLQLKITLKKKRIQGPICNDYENVTVVTSWHTHIWQVYNYNGQVAYMIESLWTDLSKCYYIKSLGHVQVVNLVLSKDLRMYWW